MACFSEPQLSKFSSTRFSWQVTRLKRATEKQRMARRLATKKGQQIYARRKAIVEPVFGQMHTLQNAKRLLLRGLEAARGEWLLLAACHNIRKLHGHIGVTGLAALATS